MLTVPSSMHAGTLPEHTYVLIDGDGYVRSVLDDSRMGIRNDALLTSIGQLGSVNF